MLYSWLEGNHLFYRSMRSAIIISFRGPLCFWKWLIINFFSKNDGKPLHQYSTSRFFLTISIVISLIKIMEWKHIQMKPFIKNYLPLFAKYLKWFALLINQLLDLRCCRIYSHNSIQMVTSCRWARTFFGLSLLIENAINLWLIYKNFHYVLAICCTFLQENWYSFACVVLRKHYSLLSSLTFGMYWCADLVHRIRKTWGVMHLGSDFTKLSPEI